MYHPNRAVSWADGTNLLQELENNEDAQYRDTNPYYPFAGEDEWNLVRWMMDACLTQQQIDAFIRLAYVCIVSLFLISYAHRS